MIKLIATDMDGTLLDENSQLPKDFPEVLTALQEKNITFVIASGRPYLTLQKTFENLSENLTYICDNGAYILEPGKEPIISIMNKHVVKEIISVCNTIPNIYPILCGVNGFYYTDCPKDFEREIKKYYIQHNKLANLLDVDDEIFKIAICDMNGSKENSHPILSAQFGKDYNVVVSGLNWVDINNKGISKGVALKKIQENLTISPDECMAFGDYNNDLEMLDAVTYSFAMENAADDIKAHAKYTAKKNTENGVMLAIREYIGIE